ncbi:hypothetical protein L1887_34213 [Cichorium endivia]|nr:hypothetical protein L1887_34213 [Cichorium endivia]
MKILNHSLRSMCLSTQTLLNFVRLFRKCHEENLKQAELERKKAEKEVEMEKTKGINLTKKVGGHAPKYLTMTEYVLDLLHCMMVPISRRTSLACQRYFDDCEAVINEQIKGKCAILAYSLLSAQYGTFQKRFLDLSRVQALIDFPSGGRTI